MDTEPQKTCIFKGCNEPAEWVETIRIEGKIGHRQSERLCEAHAKRRDLKT